MDIDHQLRGVMRDVFGVSDAEYRDELSPEHVKDWDSVNHMTLQLTLEQTFQITFEPHEAEQLRSVGAIKAALARKLR